MSIRSLLIISTVCALGVFFVVGKDAMTSLSTPEEMNIDIDTVSQTSNSSGADSFLGFAGKSNSESPFDDTSEVDASGITLLKFGASWCGPCRSLDKELDKLESKYPSLTITRVDVDSQARKAQDFGVSSIPHSFLMKNGKRIGNRVGFQSEEKLERWVKENVDSKPSKMHTNPFVK